MEKHHCIKTRFGYSVDRPEKCCWNCACSTFLYSASCSRITAEFITIRGSDDDLAIDGCGMCSKWISKPVAEIYKNSSSLEEARLKASVISDGSYTEELDNMLCEKKATPKMLEYMSRILEEGGLSGKLSAVPFDAVVNTSNFDGPFLKFYPSKSFWLVHEWLRINAPVYEEFMENRRRDAAGKKNLKNLMIRIGADAETWYN